MPSRKPPAPLTVDAPRGADIRALRDCLALSQADLARFAGVHVNTLARAERGELELSAAAWSLALLALDQHPTARLAGRRSSPAASAAGRENSPSVPAGKPAETSATVSRKTRRDLRA
jgi:transcriptional regulator with XRE-family HTH domain